MHTHTQKKPLDRKLTGGDAHPYPKKPPDRKGDLEGDLEPFEMPNADLYLVQVSENLKGGKIHACAGSHVNEVDFFSLGHFGQIIMGPQTPEAKQSILNGFARGAPCVVVHKSGGLASFLGFLIETVRPLCGTMMEGATDVTELIFAAEDVEDPPPRGITKRPHEKKEKELSDVNPSLLLEYVVGKVTNTGKFEDEGATGTNKDEMTKFKENLNFTVADVTRLIDLMKARPQYFQEAVAIVDPLKHTPESVLKSCQVASPAQTLGLKCWVQQLQK